HEYRAALRRVRPPQRAGLRRARVRVATAVLARRGRPARCGLCARACGVVAVWPRGRRRRRVPGPRIPGIVAGRNRCRYRRLRVARQDRQTAVRARDVRRAGLNGPTGAGRTAASVVTFDELVAEAVAAPFSGWDFGWLDARSRTQELPWRYADEVAARS